MRRGDAFARAGLTNGVNHVIDLVDEAVSGEAAFRATDGEGEPVEFDLSEVDWDQAGAAQGAEAAADGLTLNRLEDGVWDPRNPSDFYFTTTDGGVVDASRARARCARLRRRLAAVVRGHRAPAAGRHAHAAARRRRRRGGRDPARTRPTT